jgi:uncharacterized protein with NAD-binding domain and iron-sulfur cluster
MRIAVVGSGISGLSAACLLGRRHEVHLFERSLRLGGHTQTVVHDVAGRALPLDTGFIVFNEATYPNLTRVFAELGVATQPSEMSFSISSENPELVSLTRLFLANEEVLAPPRLVDYRDVEGSFDAVVSIEMLEAVGHRYLGAFFAVCDRVLRPGGRVALQTITIPDQVYDRYRRGTDWIRKYVSFGGHLPSLGAVQGSLARRTSFVIDRLENISDHYATTLRQWRRRFWIKIDAVRSLGFDERFVRMWDFYLATCEAAFLERQIGNLQLQLSRAGEPGRGRSSGSAPS